MAERDKIQSVIDGWLKIATDGLAEEARERVRAEIETHGRDTCEALVAEGYTPAAALQAMLLSLGDPRAARRSLRRVHLTEDQELYLRQLIRPRRWRRLEAWTYALVFGLPAVYCLLFLELPVFTNGAIFALLAWMLLIDLLSRAERWVLRRQPPRRLLDLMILFKSLEFTLYTLIFALLRMKFHREFPVGLLYLVFSVNTLWPLPRIISIRSKLGKEERTEGPDRYV